MHYSAQPRDQIFVKAYEFLSVEAMKKYKWKLER